MKPLLYVLAILAAGGAAYFTHTHSQKLEARQIQRLETVQKNKTVTANVDATDQVIKEQQELLEKSQEQEALVTASVSSLQQDKNLLEKELKALDATLATQQEEFVELQKVLDEVNVILASLDGDVTLDTLPEKIAEIEQDKKSRELKLNELTVGVESARKQLEANRAEASRLAQRRVTRTARLGGNSVEAVITAVNPDWGFVVIGAGSNSGFTPETSLLVQRGGRFIGRVKPSSVEATQTIAEVDKNSLAPGVRLQPGDRVLLAQPATD